jgi:predicted nucleic acid-binding protein
MLSIAIVDSGPLVAAANTADPDHEACLAALREPRVHLVIPALCVAEAAYLLASRQGARVEARFIGALADFDVQAPAPEDWPRMAALIETSADLGLGATDASVVAAAERLHTDTVITLDRRHFTTVRPAHRERLRLLP